ncbi:hypothetical protein Taro_052731 [Colocasia esculenta]|uniref:Uncharacterized protein n=1 Tax=Colocasia esculenta TaxID=4460 RepID=A0A843XJF4_COLES|nr:hypothetical protein [Colocasia esculenta]
MIEQEYNEQYVVKSEACNKHARYHIVNHTHENKMREEVHAISRELQWYNQPVGHVGIHGQRRLTEALGKRSLVLLIRNDR